MNNQQWKALVSDVMTSRNQFSQEDFWLLDQVYLESDKTQFELINRMLLGFLPEILAVGNTRQVFGDPERLKDNILYDTVETTYLGGSVTFLNLTRAFLTFWREYLDIAHDQPMTVMHRAILHIISFYKKHFFPAVTITTAAPFTLFAEKQRSFLIAFGSGINIDDFFLNNPLLVHTSNPLKGTGFLKGLFSR